RDKRPFSLDAKLSNLDAYLPPYRSICEFRLLAIEKDCRHPTVFQGLMSRLGQYCEERGYDLGVMSGTVRQSGLYQQLGFVPFGPLVGAPGAQFQPMYVTRDAYGAIKERFQAIFQGDGENSPSIY
ncbi:MAG: aminotransferase V, partial [Acidiferrobacterales bacterium]